jgi:hypothetical protein
MIPVQVDQGALTKLLGDYQVGKLQALLVGNLHRAAVESRRKLSGTMRSILLRDLEKYLPDGERWMVSTKLDGEFALLFFDGQACGLINPGGTIRVGLPCLEVAAEALRQQGFSSAMLLVELHYVDGVARGRVHDVSRIARRPERQADLEKLHLGVFDVVSWVDGEPKQPSSSYEERYALFSSWFHGFGSVAAIEMKVVDSLAEIRRLYEARVVDQNAEGLVVRSDKFDWFKLKPLHTVDAVIIGFTESQDDRSGMLHNLLLGLMRDDGTYQELGQCGGGFSDEQRRDWLKRLRERVCASSYKVANSDHVVHEMVAPGIIVEVSVLDLLTERSRGDAILSMSLEYRDGGYSPIQRMPFCSMISPVFVRERTDKFASPKDVGVAQIASLVEIERLFESAKVGTLPESKLLRREVRTKVLKGATAVRKVLLWETNKPAPLFPKYVVYAYDLSTTRAEPEDREMRVTDSLDQANDLFDGFATKMFVKGWEPVQG